VTCANVDQTAPTATSRAPLPNTVGTSVQGGVITVTFSEAINTATVTNSSFTVQSAAGPVTGTISFGAGNTQATFTPSATLAFDTSYTVTVTTGVTDPSGNALPGNVVWGFNTGKRLAFGFKHTCSRTDDGRIKCWGRNNEGQLGYDDTTNRGNGVGPNTNTLAAVNLGTGRTAVAISAGDFQTCAILDNGDTKCWGSNSNGEAGQGTVSAGIGRAAGQMAALQPINFGAGRRAIEIASGQRFTCARLDDNTVKCWGRNAEGQLGQGNVAELGVAPGDIAAAAPVDLGAGLTPIALSLGHHHVCAVLTDSGGTRHTKCWGDNRWGQLGRGDTTNRGDNGGEMGAALPDVTLGTGLTVDTLMATGGHNCAKLSDLSTKCWGLNTWGQVGLNAGNNNPADPLLCAGADDCIGDAANEMGDSLPPAIAAGNTAKMSLGYRHGCVLLTSGTLNCWGTNQEGQLGLGDNAGPKAIIGDAAGEMGALAATALKPGKIVEELTAGGFHTCVWNTDDTLNCWGHNDTGQLGRNDTNTWGDGPNEMGANLIDVDLGS
jgi:alpha-tubulin suppressor-like RCC1 family protein